MTELGHLLQVKPAGFVDGLNMRAEGERVIKDDVLAFGLKNGVGFAIYLCEKNRFGSERQIKISLKQFLN